MPEPPHQLIRLSRQPTSVAIPTDPATQLRLSLLFRTQWQPWLMQTAVWRSACHFSSIRGLPWPWCLQQGANEHAGNFGSKLLCVRGCAKLNVRHVGTAWLPMGIQHESKTDRDFSRIVDHTAYEKTSTVCRQSFQWNKREKWHTCIAWWKLPTLDASTARKCPCSTGYISCKGTVRVDTLAYSQSGMLMLIWKHLPPCLGFSDDSRAAIVVCWC